MVDTSRAQRISDQVRRELGRLLLQESKDPRFQLLAITDCEVSRDLSFAKVYFTLTDKDADILGTVAALDKASGFFRSRLASELNLRKTPKIRFIHDTSVEEGRRISAVVDKAIAEDMKSPHYQENSDEK